MTSRSTVSSSDEDGSPTPTEKYLLKVTAGTSYQASTEKTVVTNGDDCVLNDKTRVAVRIQEYQGIPGQSVATSDYFKDAAHTKDTYSIAFSWIPETDVSADDLTWGIELVSMQQRSTDDHVLIASSRSTQSETAFHQGSSRQLLKSAKDLLTRVSTATLTPTNHGLVEPFFAEVQ